MIARLPISIASKMIRFGLYMFLLLQSLLAGLACADESTQQVKIADPFIELHTGPGEGYPVFHVIERGELVDVIMRRTTWFKLRSSKGVEGWVTREQMTLTLTPAGEAIEFKQVTQREFEQRQWEYGILGGEFGGATEFSIYAARLFNDGFAGELGYAEAVGGASSSQLFKLGLLMFPFPDWRVSPYFYLGTGLITVTPNATLAVPQNIDNQFSNVALGARFYLTRTMILRAEVGDYVLFSADQNNDVNERVSEWKLGFAIFF
jgi:hypothetical protein